MRFLFASILFLNCSFAVGEATSSDKGLDYLVQKLEKQNRVLPRKHFSKKAVTLRLAHTLSLRAEKYMSEKWSANCKSCFKKGAEDAQRSLVLYGQLDSHMKTRHSSLYALSLFERAYLNRLLDYKGRSIFYLKQVVALKKVKSELIIRAHFNLGETYFDSNKYGLALKHFNSALSSGRTKWSLQSSYKKIWSLYNLSQYNKAVQILESFLMSDLYKAQLQNPEDQELKNKIQNELIVFYSKASLSQKSIDFLYQFKKDNPKKNSLTERNQRIFNLGIALNRIGRVPQSTQAWQFYLTKENNPLKQLEAYTYVIDNQAHSGYFNFFSRVEEPINKSFDLLVKIGSCSKPVCQVIKDRMKQYILTRSNADVKNQKLRQFLISRYNAIYPNEFEMIFYQARLAKDFKQYKAAQDLFQKSVSVFKINSKLSQKDKNNLMRDKEKVSVLQIEMAELTKDKKRQLDAYNFYLKHGTDQNLIFKTEYQKAYLDYTDKNYKKSAKQFQNLALRDNLKTKQFKSLKLQAAHLTLTSFSFLKDDESMLKWSQVFSQSFPTQKKAFIKTRNTAIFNVVRTLVSGKSFSSYPVAPSSNRNILKAWKTLLQIDIKHLNQKEKVNFYINKLLLAKEILKLKEVKDSIGQLSSQKLNKKDRQLIFNAQLWVAETEFDFKNVLRIVRKIKPNDDSKEHLIYLASLFELAGKNHLPIYEKIIRKYPKSDEAFSLAVHMVNLSLKNKQTAVLQKYKNQLIRRPEVFSYLILKADRGNLNEQFITSFLKDKSMASSDLAQFVRRKQFIKAFKKDNKTLESFSIPKKSSQKKLTRALKRYKVLLAELESRANQAIQLQDWTSQIIAFSVTRRELNRFYQGVIELPLPKDLTAEETKQYTNLLKNQLAPYKLRTESLNQKLEELWKYDYATAYKLSYSKDEVFQKPIVWEIQQLREVVPNTQKHVLNRIISKKIKSISTAEISKDVIRNAFNKVKSKPFDKAAMRQLMKLESKRKNEVMVFYLKSRLKKINNIANKRAQLL